MAWNNTYDPMGVAGVISEHKPGEKIAACIKEIQERVVRDAELEVGDGLEGEIEKTGNSIRIRIALDPSSDGDDRGYDPDGDGSAPVPEGFTGMFTSIESLEVDLTDRTLRCQVYLEEYEAGLLKSRSILGSEQFTLPTGIPAGGSQYHVLQRGAGGSVVWGPVRFPS